MKSRNILLSLVCLLAVGCTATRTMPEPVGAYRAALAAARTNTPAPFARGSAQETAALAQVKALFADLSEANARARVREVYAADAFFNDTLKTLHGVDAIEAYVVRSAQAAESVTTIFEDMAESNGDYYLRWVMDIRFKKFRRGETTRTIGITHLRFNPQGKVVLHQDYWDSAAGLYQHVPVVGGMIRFIQRRL